MKSNPADLRRHTIRVLTQVTALTLTVAVLATGCAGDPAGSNSPSPGSTGATPATSPGSGQTSTPTAGSSESPTPLPGSTSTPVPVSSETPSPSAGSSGSPAPGSSASPTPSAGSSQPPIPSPVLGGNTAGLWIGTTQGSKDRTSKWLSAGYTLHGDFWFRADDTGNVHGYATVVYEPRADTTGVNEMIDYAKNIESGLVGLAMPGILGGLATMNNSVLALMLGVQVSFADPMPIRSGPIAGTLKNGQLSIGWAGGEDVEIPMKFVLHFMGGERDQTLGDIGFVTQAPWPTVANIVDDEGSWLAIASDKASAPDEDDEVTETRSSQWSAHRVGDGD